MLKIYYCNTSSDKVIKYYHMFKKIDYDSSNRGNNDIDLWLSGLLTFFWIVVKNLYCKLGNCSQREVSNEQSTPLSMVSASLLEAKTDHEEV